MSRRRSVKVIEREISLEKNRILRAKARYDAHCKRLSDLQAEREKVMAEDIITALKRSGKSYQELMTFLGR